MASPGNIFGGLATIGAQGATGGLEGLVEGEVLKRRFMSEDVQRSLQNLRLMLEAQRLGQPMGFAPGTMLFDPQTGRPMGQVPFAPQRPVPVGPGHTLVDPSTNQPIFSAPPATQRPVPVGPGHSLVDPGTRQIIMSVPATPPRPVSVAPGAALVDPGSGKTLIERPAAERPPTESQFWAGIGQAVEKGTATPAQRALWEQHKKTAPGQKPTVRMRDFTDDQGNVRSMLEVYDPASGEWKQQIRQMPDLKGRSAPGLTPRTTTTETTKITPRKTITDPQTVSGLQNAVNALALQASKKPGWADSKSATVLLPDGSRRTREQILAEAMRIQFGVDVTVRWDGSRFKIVTAATPSQREPIETRRTTGPPAQTPQTEAEPEDEGGEQ